METNNTLVINLRDELCSRCSVCRSACPFEAISQVEDKIVVDTTKCMVCGICSSACPSGIITPYYYSYNELVEKLKREMTPRTTDLVVACRGSTDPLLQSPSAMSELDTRKAVLLRVPCVGRLSPIFYMTALSMGIQRIVAIQCKEDFCRFTKGSLVNRGRLTMLGNLVRSFGYPNGTVSIIEGAKQVEYDTAKCVGCDKCVHACPYQAIEAQALATPKINYEKCTGCGACTVVCPHLALEIRGYECTSMAEVIKDYSKRVKKTKAGAPAILVLCCQWAEFPNLDRNEKGLIRPNVALLEIPCFSKLDPINVLQAFVYGFDGVLAFACSDTDCKSKESRITTENNVNVLITTGLKSMGLSDRFKIHKSSPRTIGDFDAQVDLFVNTILLQEKKIGTKE